MPVEVVATLVAAIFAFVASVGNWIANGLQFRATTKQQEEHHSAQMKAAKEQLEATQKYEEKVLASNEAEAIGQEFQHRLGFALTQTRMEKPEDIEIGQAMLEHLATHTRYSATDREYAEVTMKQTQKRLLRERSERRRA